jgi:hypothetical protein
MCKLFNILDDENKRDGSQSIVSHDKKRCLSKHWFARKQEMALKMLVYMRTRDGSQNVDLHENKGWLSKCCFA